MLINYNRARLQIGCYRMPKPRPGVEKLTGFYDGRKYISQKEYENILKDLSMTEVYVTVIELWFSVIEEIDSLKPIIAGFSHEIYSDYDELKLKVARKQERKVERKFMNMLTLFRSFLDQIETFLKRNFAEADECFSKWKEVKHKAYDNYFSYRFLYKLRNYVQHVGMAPIIWVNTSQKSYNIKMFFAKEDLILHKDVFGSALIKELHETHKYIDSSEIIDNFHVCLLEVLNDFVKIVDEKVRGSALRVLSIREGFENSAEVGIFRVSETPEDNEFTTTIYKYINESSSVLINNGFPYSHDAVLHPDLQ
jgi:hypothetical protein